MTLTEITTILQLIKQNSSDLVLIAIMLLIVVAFATAIISTIKFTTILLKRKILGKETEQECEENTACELNKHPFFQRCENLVKYDVYKINFGGKVRNLLFMDMLQSKIKVFSDNMCDFSSKSHKNVGEWTEDLINILEKTIREYNRQWEDLGCPRLAIDKFNEWHNEKIINAKDYVLRISASNFYNTIYKKNNAVLDSLIVLFNQTCEDMYDSAYALNGELTGIIYKGQPIEALIHKH